jgi:hypothetical protein
VLRCHLWAGNVKDQIQKMKDLWQGFKEKPQWLSWEEILEYEKQMIKTQTTIV